MVQLAQPRRPWPLTGEVSFYTKRYFFFFKKEVMQVKFEVPYLWNSPETHWEAWMEDYRDKKAYYWRDATPVEVMRYKREGKVI